MLKASLLSMVVSTKKMTINKEIVASENVIMRKMLRMKIIDTENE